MRQRYGSTQVCDFQMSKADVERMIRQSIAERCDPSYDFDTRNGMVIWEEGGGCIVRFVQQKATHDSDRGDVWMKPLEKKS